MADLLHRLLFDLKQRCEDIAAELDLVKSILPQDILSYRDRTAHTICRTQKLIGSLLIDPGLKHPKLAANYYRDYKRIAELIQTVEDYPTLVLSRFCERDLFMTRLVCRICQEIVYPHEAPICTSISSQHFWINPKMNLIFVPCLEAYHLLSAPDIYHEIGHIVLFRNQKILVIPIYAIIDRFYDKAVKKAKQNGWTPGSIENLNRYRQYWKQNWFLEFASDIIAVYCVGPAFGWCNVRLCTNLASDLFEGSDSHPADDARMTAIAIALETLGFSETAKRIAVRWSELVSLSSQRRPQEYDLAYPSQLLQKIVEFTIEKCREIGLQHWHNGNASEGSIHIGSLLNAAWDDFHASPDSFTRFEKQQIFNLKTEFGL
jgi:hypothetical protein